MNCYLKGVSDMKIVVVKAPKFFKGILKSIFKIKSEE